MTPSILEQFEARRPYLRAVAVRMLGSHAEADDAVQEAWLRLQQADKSALQNVNGWLTTVVARICLDMLRMRTARREESLDEQLSEAVGASAEEHTPEDEALLADSVGLALLVVLDMLAPAERLALILHDVFAVPFDDIALIVERSPEAARKLASRARARVRGATSMVDGDRARQRTVVDAFLRAAREGDFAALLQVLDPDVVFRADDAAVALGGSPEIRGATVVARQFLRRAQTAHTALVDETLGFVVMRGDTLLLVVKLTIECGIIMAMQAIAEAAHLATLRVVVLADQQRR